MDLDSKLDYFKYDFLNIKDITLMDLEFWNRERDFIKNETGLKLFYG